MHDLVRARRHDVFLDQHLDAVRHRLKKPERPDAIWPVAILHAPENFPLQHRDEREEREKHTEQRENVDEARRDLDHPVGRPGSSESSHCFARMKIWSRKSPLTFDEGKR